MKLNKTIGWVFFIFFLIMINPIPGPDDVIGLQLYSMYSGVPLDVSSISEIYLDYFIFSMILSLAFLVLAMYFLKWNLKKILKKLDVGKYKISLGIGVGALILITYLDLLNLIYSLLGILALIYYFQIRKDKSEALAVFISPLILFWFGLSDLLTFIFQRIPIPELVCCTKAPVVWISSTLGFSAITPLSLVISIIIGFLSIFLLTKVLKEKF